MKNELKNPVCAGRGEGGFLQLIIIIIVVLLIMSYFNISISGVANWLAGLFHTVFK